MIVFLLGKNEKIHFVFRQLRSKTEKEGIKQTDFDKIRLKREQFFLSSEREIEKVLEVKRVDIKELYLILNYED